MTSLYNLNIPSNTLILTICLREHLFFSFFFFIVSFFLPVVYFSSSLAATRFRFFSIHFSEVDCTVGETIFTCLNARGSPPCNKMNQVMSKLQEKDI
uniref:Putative ovule protein n=1 Tax=Solanum chacoense TaxID=4108 RepID=A0A0V0GYN2_SOLCH